MGFEPAELVKTKAGDKMPKWAKLYLKKRRERKGSIRQGRAGLPLKHTQPSFVLIRGLVNSLCWALAM